MYDRRWNVCRPNVLRRVAHRDPAWIAGFNPGTAGAEADDGPRFYKGKRVEWRASTDWDQICHGVLIGRWGTAWRVRRVDIISGITIDYPVIEEADLYEPGTLRH
jgi:hypothetical protein